MSFIITKSILLILKRYCFYISAVLALLLPDLQLRFLASPNLYSEFFATVVPALFNLAWIGIVLCITRIILPRRAGKIVYIITCSVFIVFSFAQYIYFGIFDQFFRVSSINLAGEGGNYITYTLGYIDKWVITCTLAAIACMIVAAIKWNQPVCTGKRAKLAIIIPLLTLAGLHIFMNPALFNESESEWNSWSKPRVIYHQFNDANKCVDIAGLYHYTAMDIYKTYISKNEYSQQQYAKVTEFFENKRANSVPNQYTGIFEGKNVIAVMMESIDDWMISEKFTPVIKYMMENGINFTNHYAPTFGTGYTLGSEFCFNTGFYTPKSAASVVNYTSNKYPYALPQLFKNKGYSVNSFHYNYPDYYNRVLLHKSIGYEKYHSFMNYNLTAEQAQSDSNILKCDEIYNDIVSEAPFFSFIITYSGHVPYVFDDAKLTTAKLNHLELADDTMDYEEYSCRILAKDTDDFFRMMLERLHADGILENTVIVAYTDHYAYGYSDPEKLRLLNKAAGDGSNYRVPAFIYTPGMQPVQITKTTQTADLMPTLINLFGLQDTCTYVGNDALDDKYDGLAYFSNCAWKDSNLFYVPELTEITDDNKQIIQLGNAVVEELMEINDIVIAGDYFANDDSFEQ